MNMDMYAEIQSRDPTRVVGEPTSDPSNLLNINDLPLPLHTGSETAIFQSAVFIEDGIYHRSIHHKIDPTSLKIYRVYYSRPVRWIFGFFIFVNLMLAFFEYPTSMSLSSDYRFRDVTWHLAQPPCGVTEGIELVCLIVFFIDCYAKLYLLGWRRFVARPWLSLYAVMVVVSFIDIVISLSFCDSRDAGRPLSLGYTLRIRRFFRPFFFLISSSIMKKFTKAAIYTLPQIFSVLFLLALHIYVFAMFGLLVFPRDLSSGNNTNSTGPTPSNPSIPWSNNSNASLITNYDYYADMESNKYFGNIFDALTSLLVLLTTANHPDVMIPIYQYNRFSSLYFIIFLGIGAFIILNLLIAATYNQFRGFFQKSLQSSFRRRRVAFRAAFTILARQTRKSLPKRASRIASQEAVSRALIRQLVQKARIPKKILPEVYTKLEARKRQQDGNRKQDGDDREQDGGREQDEKFVKWPQFIEIFDVVTEETSRSQEADGSSRSRYYTQVRAFQWFQFAIRHRFFNYFTYFISVVNVILVTVELEIAYNQSFTETDSRLAFYNLIFVIYYTIEQIMKLVAYGCRGYFRNVGNVYEGVVTCALIFLEFIVLVLYDSPVHTHHPHADISYLNVVIRLMNIFIVLRLLRILVQVNSLKLLVSTIVDLVWNVRGFFGIIVVVYYLFAFLGMELFFDVDGPSSHNKTCKFDYDESSYYGNNFLDFASALVTLWDVMVVNNWFLFLDKFACDSFLGTWAKLYFIVWWLVSAVISVNLFISLVLEIFLIRFEVWHAQTQGDGLRDGNQTEAGRGASQISDIQHLLRSNLVEPDEADIMHELHRHKDLMLV